MRLTTEYALQGWCVWSECPGWRFIAIDGCYMDEPGEAYWTPDRAQQERYAKDYPGDTRIVRRQVTGWEVDE